MTDETKHLNTVFFKKNYSTDFIERNTLVRPNNSSNNFYTTATIPYTREASVTIAGILRPYKSELHTNAYSFYNAYSLMLWTNVETYQEQFRRSNAPTARPLKSVRSAGT